MSISDYLKIRPEVISKNGLEGVIDLENLRSGAKKTIEARPKDFFEITYPTSDIRNVINNLQERFNSGERSTGLFLFEGLKGSGKSHLELLIYHMFKHPEIAESWFSLNGIDFQIPRDTVVVIHKFTDFPLDSIWQLIFNELGVRMDSRENCPNLNQFREALGNRKLILILDELEIGIQRIEKKEAQKNNIAFLQMLSEESARTSSADVTIFATVYDSTIEPGLTLKRVNPINIRFNDKGDKLKIIQHRLFSNSEELKDTVKDSVVNSYSNILKRQGIEIDESDSDLMKKCYPFSPILIKKLTDDVQSRGGFQGTRGALGLLAILLKNEYKRSDLITSMHLDIIDKAISNRLYDLDSSKKIIQAAENDLQELENLEYVKEIASSVLFATLVPSGRIPGISYNELVKETSIPGSDINKFNSTLNALQKLGSYFQSQEGNYFFDVVEKPNAKVEYRSIGVDTGKAREYALNLWKDSVFCESRAVVLRDIDQAKAELNTRDKNSLRFVLSSRRLSEEERDKLYNGVEYRNQVILLEPRDDKFSAAENPDILKWAKRAIAAEELESNASDERRKQYESIKNQERNYIKESFKRAGLSFVWFQNNINDNSVEAELESLGNSTTKDEVIKKLREDIFPRLSFEEHILNRIDEVKDRSVRDLEVEYRKTLGFPVHTALTTFLSAVKSLCSEMKIGLIHERDRSCGRNPNLNDTELLDARITEPFEDPALSYDLNANGKRAMTNQDRSGEMPTFQETPVTVMPQEYLKSTITVHSSFKDSLNSLRQEVALKLEEYSDCVVKEIRFFIFYEQKDVELSQFSNSFRGSLSGISDMTIDLNILKRGDYSKAQVEQMVESLTNLKGATYKAEMKVLVLENTETE
jgi:hypothetical protein